MSKIILSRFYASPKLRSSRVSSGGRNATGRITVRHKGGGHKRANRLISWSGFTKGLVVGFAYDPSRTSNLVKIISGDDVIYVPNSGGVKNFQTTQNFEHLSNSFQHNLIFQPGDKARLGSFEPGDFVHSVSAFPNSNAIFARSAGTFCQIISRETAPQTTSSVAQGYTVVRLPSGSYRRISTNATAYKGTVALPSSQRIFSKAGRSRWLGVRPTVRGVAINPVDHPHGGNSFGRPSVTFKGWPTKGQPTRRSKAVSWHIFN